jgi:hypothetical protein
VSTDAFDAGAVIVMTNSRFGLLLAFVRPWQGEHRQGQERRRSVDLDTFLRDENIRRYRRLVDSSIGSSERQMILKLLAEEMAKLKSKHHKKKCRRE